MFCCRRQVFWSQLNLLQTQRWARDLLHTPNRLIYIYCVYLEINRCLGWVQCINKMPFHCIKTVRLSEMFAILALLVCEYLSTKKLAIPFVGTNSPSNIKLIFNLTKLHIFCPFANVFVHLTSFRSVYMFGFLGCQSSYISVWFRAFFDNNRRSWKSGTWIETGHIKGAMDYEMQVDLGWNLRQGM